ncbi:hypothetical protein LC612_31730 [Nostoc sp. CHAB 5834]|nr:hypothetical protein [Nostoc sp. CHAB 5834]
MKYNVDIENALLHVAQQFPYVTLVFFSREGNWMYCSEDFQAPDFDTVRTLDYDILQKASDAAYLDSGFPCAYRRAELDDYYALWDQLSDFPVAEGHPEFDDGAIEKDFLHFQSGTPREDIWRWFEAQHPSFVVGEVQQGIRRRPESLA